MKQDLVLYECDAQGLLLAEGQSLQMAVKEAYARGPLALLPADQHLVMQCSLESILSLQAVDKYSWLSAIQLTHRQANKECTNKNAQMRHTMDTWLTQGAS